MVAPKFGFEKLHWPVLVEITKTNESQFENYIITGVNNIKNLSFEEAGSIAENEKRLLEGCLMVLTICTFILLQSVSSSSLDKFVPIFKMFKS